MQSLSFKKVYALLFFIALVNATIVVPSKKTTTTLGAKTTTATRKIGGGSTIKPGRTSTSTAIPSSSSKPLNVSRPIVVVAQVKPGQDAEKDRYNGLSMEPWAAGEALAFPYYTAGGKYYQKFQLTHSNVVNANFSGKSPRNATFYNLNFLTNYGKNNNSKLIYSPQIEADDGEGQKWFDISSAPGNTTKGGAFYLQGNQLRFGFTEFVTAYQNGTVQDFSSWVLCDWVWGNPTLFVKRFPWKDPGYNNCAEVNLHIKNV